MTDTSNPITPASTGFTQNQIRIAIVLLVLILLGLGAWIGMWMAQIRTEEKAVALYLKESTQTNWKEVVEKFPTTQTAAEALLKLAAAQVEAQKYDAALEHFKKFTTLFPKHPATSSVQLAIADCLYATGQIEPSIQAYTQIIRKDHRFSGAASVKLASLYEMQGKIANAREVLNEFIAHPNASAFVGEAQIMLERLQSRINAQTAAK